MDKSSVRKEIAIVAGPREWGDTRESWLAKVCKRVPTVSYRTVRGLWYGEISNSDHWAARDIRRAAALIEGRKEAAALADQYKTLIAGLNASDPDFHRETISQLVDALVSAGLVDRTRT